LKGLPGCPDCHGRGWYYDLYGVWPEGKKGVHLTARECLRVESDVRARPGKTLERIPLEEVAR
jgi:hypothetical protein